MKIFSSYKLALVLLFILAVGAGVATFLESIYDTATAKIFVYNALWYELVMAFACLSLIVVIFKTQMWRKIGAFLIHLAFIAIFIGAATTRYFSQEGVIHVREGEIQDKMVSVEPYLRIQINEQIHEYPLNLAQIGDNYFSFLLDVNSQPLRVEFASYEPGNKGMRGILDVKVSLRGDEGHILSLKGGAGWLAEPVSIFLGGSEISLSWGSKLVDLPFSVKLDDFSVERYAGSASPSSYASDIEIIENGSSVLKYKIFMNHPLNYGGAKFFQSSYDQDELGTILEFNKDPGKWPTYFGYFLLCTGFILNLFSSQSRFKRLNEFIKRGEFTLIFALAFTLNSDAFAGDFLNELKTAAPHAKGAFGELLVQDYGGRIKPLSTQAREIISKISGRSEILGLSGEQIILGMSLDPAFWSDQKIIKIVNSQIKSALNLDENEKFASFNFMFDELGNYKLKKQVEAANEKPVAKRDAMDNELIKLDERINVTYLALKGVFFRFIPSADGEKWLSPSEAFADESVNSGVKIALDNYLNELRKALSSSEFTLAELELKKLKGYQKLNSRFTLPGELKIKAEILYNELGIFEKLLYFYLIFGLVMLVFALFCVFSSCEFTRSKKTLYFIFVFAFTLHTLGLVLRWYIAGHAPWSDSYESMIYIGWSAALAGVAFFRNSPFILSAASLLASVVMLVAHMNFVNPQITNLVPVLKSYWLTIHVSVITASYGFLGLGSLLGFLGLVLMACKNSKNAARVNSHIRYIAAIDEISLIVGLSMLTAGNFFGGIWANESWGRYWGWDSKETWSYVSIIVYVIVLHLRFVRRLNSVYLFLITSMIAYASIIMTYFGVNFYLTGMHSYAAGEAPQIPSFAYFVLVILALLCAVAYRGKDVKTI